VKPGPALDAEKIRIIEAQAEGVRQGAFFLAGGTGLAIRLHHRVSKDLDWFTGRPFDAQALRRALDRAPLKPTATEQHSDQTVRAYYGTFETSFILYKQVPSQTDEVQVARNLSVPLAKLELLAAMKAAAVHDRGTKRDFVDIYAICKEPGWSVARFIDHAARMLPLKEGQVALALTYFADAERQPMPGRCKFTSMGDRQEGASRRRTSLGTRPQ
jgi:hypothetical protein